MNNLSIRKMNEVSKRKKKGFTLVELIIVIAIIAILAAIAIPKFGAIRTSANQKADLANAKNIQTVVATNVANETSSLYAIPTTSTNTVVSNTTLLTLLDTKTLVSKVNSTEFTAEIDSSGDVHVLAGTAEVYPNTNTAWN